MVIVHGGVGVSVVNVQVVFLVDAYLLLVRLVVLGVCRCLQLSHVLLDLRVVLEDVEEVELLLEVGGHVVDIVLGLWVEEGGFLSGVFKSDFLFFLFAKFHSVDFTTKRKVEIEEEEEGY